MPELRLSKIFGDKMRGWAEMQDKRAEREELIAILIVAVIGSVVLTAFVMWITPGVIR